MRKTKSVISILLISVVFSSCATVLGGPRTSYQQTKPKEGEPKREVAVGFLIADILLFPIAMAWEFPMGHIYKDQPSKTTSIE